MDHLQLNKTVQVRFLFNNDAGNVLGGPMHGGTGRHAPDLATARRPEMANSSLVRFLAELGACSEHRKSLSGKCGQSGPARLIVYCSDYKCAHSVVIDAGRWGDDVRISELEPKFICRACGHRGADIRPLFEQARMGTPQAERVQTKCRAPPPCALE